MKPEFASWGDGIFVHSASRLVKLDGSGGCSPTSRNSTRRKYVSDSRYFPQAWQWGAKLGDTPWIALRDWNSP